MSERHEPPDWALPAWDALTPEAERGAGVRRPAPDRTAAPSASSVPPALPVPSTPAAPGTFGVRILTVGEVTRAIRDSVRADERLRELWVEGEVGRVTISSAGHAYFSLKDERAQLQCVWFRDDRLASPFEPQAGLRVVAHGRIDLYEPTGGLQLYVSALQPAGFGDLALRFEALKARLAAEGLFDVARKRALPARPAVVAVVTSPTGAVWHDISNVLRRRWPLATVLVVPCQVQGETAPASIVAALRRVDRHVEALVAADRPAEAPSVTILARGGGSLEDLWPFNDERVVRAVVAHRVPVVCGVGHEVDVTLADFAADVRAPTPSAAAELVVPDRLDVARRLDAVGRRLGSLAAARLAAAGRDLGEERRALERLRPEAQLAAARERAGLLLDRAARVVLDRVNRGRQADERAWNRLTPLVRERFAAGRQDVARAGDRLPVLVDTRVASSRGALDAAAAALAALGPQATLDRGYAIVRRADDAIVRAPSEAPAGELLHVTLARGELRARSEGEARTEQHPG